MFVVLFEVEPFADRWDEYLAHAASLRPELERMEGFLDNRRYRSLRRPGWLLSLSTWRDEKALIRWRTHAGHHTVQAAGRQSVFRDYRIRVGEVIADGGTALPRTRLDATAATVTLIEDAAIDPPATVPEWDRFEGITVAGTSILLLSWPGVPDASALAGVNVRNVAVIRDYGLRDRREAPQYHPPAPVRT